MKKIRVLFLGVLAACGGAEAGSSSRSRPVAPPVATVAASASATASASVEPPGPAPFALATSQPLPADAPNLDALDSPAALAKKYGGATVTPAARVRALGDFANKWDELAKMPRAARERAAVAWLSARPEIEAAGLGTGGVWARFKDGKMIVVPTYPWNVPSKGHAAAEREPSSKNAKADIPQSKGLATPDWFGFPAHAAIAGWLGEHGYKDSGATPSVASLRTGVKDAGIFYIETHGSDGIERDIDIARQRGEYDHLYALMTSTLVLDGDGKPITNPSTSGAMLNDLQHTRASAGERSQIDDELSRGELVYFFADEGGGHAAWHYGFTHRFVKKYFTFSKNAFVYLSACSSHGASALDMDAAFLNKGAAVVVGWTKEVTPNTAMRAVEFVFDRMLGENKMNDYGLHPDKPFQRPWNFANTYGDLHAKGYDREINAQGEPNKLDYTGDTSVAIVPIIDKMESDDIQHILTLHGTFGDDPGGGNRKVTIAKADCPIKEWAPAQITCALGDDFKHGDVVVTKLDRTSNPSPLTGWIIPASYDVASNQAGHFGFGLGFEAHVRGDVHAVRATPEDAPTPRDPVPFYAAPDSKCGSAGDKGFYAARGGKAWMVGGHSSLKLLEGRPMGTDWCTLYGQIDAQGHKLKLAIFGITARNAGTLMVQAHGMHTYGMAGGVVPLPNLFDGSVSPPPGMPAPAMPTAVFLSMDETGHITNGTKGPVNFPSTNKANATVQWGDAKPDDYPTDETPQ